MMDRIVIACATQGFEMKDVTVSMGSNITISLDHNIRCFSRFLKV
jgi:hypothetical protein